MEIGKSSMKVAKVIKILMRQNSNQTHNNRMNAQNQPRFRNDDLINFWYDKYVNLISQLYLHSLTLIT